MDAPSLTFSLSQQFRRLRRGGFLVAVFLAVTSTRVCAAANDASGMVEPQQSAAVRGTSDFAVPHGYVYELGFVALIGLATLTLQGILLVRSRASMQSATRMTLITLIVILAVGVLVMGYDQAQIAPVIGLFGSIIGYLLGRGDRSAAGGQTDLDRREED